MSTKESYSYSNGDAKSPPVLLVRYDKSDQNGDIAGQRDTTEPVRDVDRPDWRESNMDRGMESGKRVLVGVK